MGRLTEAQIRALRFLANSNGGTHEQSLEIASAMRELISTKYAFIGIAPEGRAWLAEHDIGARLAAGMSSAGRAALEDPAAVGGVP